MASSASTNAMSSCDAAALTHSPSSHDDPDALNASGCSLWPFSPVRCETAGAFEFPACCSMGLVDALGAGKGAGGTTTVLCSLADMRGATGAPFAGPWARSGALGTCCSLGGIRVEDCEGLGTACLGAATLPTTILGWKLPVFLAWGQRCILMVKQAFS